VEKGYRQLCSRCFNEEVACAGALDFQHVRFVPVDTTDTVGTLHRFHFRLHLFGDHVALDAFELRKGDPGGYEFQVIGDAECDLFALMGGSRYPGPPDFRWRAIATCGNAGLSRRCALDLPRDDILLPH
jgi:hypothetical protein